MPYHLNVDDLAAAFSSGKVVVSGKPVAFEVRDIGNLVVSSGAVAASDPLVEPDPKPFTQSVPNGSFPVTVAIARFDSGDERIAYARVSFAAALPVKWKMALIGEQNLEKLGVDEFFGYGVDAGTGSFMDPVAGGYLAKRMEMEQDYYQVIIDDMDNTYKHTRSWANVKPLSAHDENVICFSSGFGDGSYPSFFGFDAVGQVVALVTDFGVLHEAPSDPAPASAPASVPVTEAKKPWWKFW